MVRTRIEFSTSLAVFSLFFLVSFLILLNGYALNLVSGYRADSGIVLVSTALEWVLLMLAARQWVSVRFDALELAGFVIVTAGVWIYFLLPSLPTLLPPTQSLDAVRHYQHILFTYPDGRLVSWYPAGGAFVGAMLSHWLNLEPLRVLHPLASAFVALSAGAVYGITCGLLSPTRLNRMASLFAPVFLFIPWPYFVGILNWEQYFYAQVVGQYFVLAALWYISTWALSPRWTWIGLGGAALLGVVAAYPYLVPLALLCFAFVVLTTREKEFLKKYRRANLPVGGDRNPIPSRNRVSDDDVVKRPRLPWAWLVRSGVVALFLVLTVLAALALQHGGIIDLKGGQIGAMSEVGEGGVANPSPDNLGGPVFLILSLCGLTLSWRKGAGGRAILAFVAAWGLQWTAMLLVQPYFQISGYRVGKTFYLLVFPLAILAALGPIHLLNRWADRFKFSRRAVTLLFSATVLLLGLGVALFRPPLSFSPFTEGELQTALWAKDHLDTYQVDYVNATSIQAYWLAMGIWGETLPNEWFQWMPQGPKLGPASLEDWRHNSAWPRWVLVRNVEQAGLGAAPDLRVLYQSGTAAILEKDSTPSTLPLPSREARWEFGSTLQLMGLDLARTLFTPGESITLTTVTESIRPPSATVGWRLELVDSKGNVSSKATGTPFSDQYPLQRWPPGKMTRDAWTLSLDPQTPPGAYELRMGLYRRIDGQEIEALPIDPATGRVLPDARPLAAVPLAKVKIPASQPTESELRTATPLQARVGDNILLSKYSLESDRVAQTIRIVLYWQCVSKMEEDYTVFVHLLDSTGRVIAQVDSPPMGSKYPTSLWDIQEIVKDSYTLKLPADAPPPPYSVEIGMYTSPDLKRLPVGADDHIRLDVEY